MSACRSPSGSPGRSSSPRWPVASRNRTAFSTCRPIGARVPAPVAGRTTLGRWPETATSSTRAASVRSGMSPTSRNRRSCQCSVSGRPTSPRARAQSGCAAGATPAASGRSAPNGRSAGGPLDRGDRRDARRPRRPGHPPDSRGAPVGRTVVLRLRFADFSRATRSHPAVLPGDRPHPDDPPGGSWSARRHNPLIEQERPDPVGISVANVEDDRRSSAQASPRPPCRLGARCRGRRARRPLRGRRHHTRSAGRPRPRAPTMPLLPD